MASKAARVVDLFREWDRNGDGELSRAEFRQGIARQLDESGFLTSVTARKPSLLRRARPAGCWIVLKPNALEKIFEPLRSPRRSLRGAHCTTSVYRTANT